MLQCIFNALKYNALGTVIILAVPLTNTFIGIHMYSFVTSCYSHIMICLLHVMVTEFLPDNLTDPRLCIGSF